MDTRPVVPGPVLQSEEFFYPFPFPPGVLEGQDPVHGGLPPIPGRHAAEAVHHHLGSAGRFTAQRHGTGREVLVVAPEPLPALDPLNPGPVLHHLTSLGVVLVADKAEYHILFLLVEPDVRPACGQLKLAGQTGQL